MVDIFTNNTIAFAEWSPACKKSNRATLIGICYILIRCKLEDLFCKAGSHDSCCNLNQKSFPILSNALTFYNLTDHCSGLKMGKWCNVKCVCECLPKFISKAKDTFLKCLIHSTDPFWTTQIALFSDFV